MRAQGPKPPLLQAFNLRKKLKAPKPFKPAPFKTKYKTPYAQDIRKTSTRQ